MNQHLKIPQPWTHMAVFLCLFGGALLLYSLVGSVLVEVLGIEQEVLKGAYPEPSDQNAINKLKILQAVSSLIIFMLPAWIFPRIIFTGRYLYFIGFKKADHSNMYLLAVLSVLMALPVVFWLGEMNRLIPLPSWLTSMERNAGKQIELFLHHRTPIDITVNVLLLALIPAFGEELCFRSVLQRIIIQIAGRPVYGIFITAFLFSALHMQFEGFLPRMLLGLILGALYWYSGSIWTSVLAHFTNNAVQVIAASYSPELIDNTPSIPVLLVISSGIGLIGILYYYAKETRQSFNRTYYPEKWGRDAPYLAD